MKFHATIEVKDEKPEMIMKAFSAELENPKKARSKFALVKKKGKVIFSISAEDSVALRATCDSIIKLLIVYEKMESV